MGLTNICHRILPSTAYLSLHYAPASLFFYTPSFAIGGHQPSRTELSIDLSPPISHPCPQNPGIPSGMRLMSIRHNFTFGGIYLETERGFLFAYVLVGGFPPFPPFPTFPPNNVGGECKVLMGIGGSGVKIAIRSGFIHLGGALIHNGGFWLLTRCFSSGKF